MKNLLILYNPYYQSDVIEQHLKILNEQERVAFGKIRSKIKTVQHSFEEQLEAIYEKTDDTNFIQLFLTDYSNLFVAKVIEVTSEDVGELAPEYYHEKSLEVEQWFIISDIRELVRDDFEDIRDNYLSNFITPNFGDHTYAIYGNSYVYPLLIDLKHSIDYFEDNTSKNYLEIYKSPEYIEIKNNLQTYSYGKKYINHMHPDSMSNIISAEIEYQANIQNPLYDFSSVVIKYSKTIEQEIFLFIKALFKYLSQKEPNILDIEYSVQGVEHRVEDIFTHKPNLGTYKFLLRNTLIKSTIEKHTKWQLKNFTLKSISYYINLTQNIRNETVHATAPPIEEVEKLRDKIVGIACESIVIELVKMRCKELN